MTTQRILTSGGPRKPLRAIIEHGHGLLRTGWLFVPVLRHDLEHSGAGKAPAISGWQRATPTPQALVRWSRDKRVSGIGIRTGEVVGIDGDILHVDAALAARALIKEMLGPTCIRVGRSPKFLMPYRLALEEVGKTARGADYHFPDLPETSNRLEVLGHPGHFVAAGIHPGTGLEYRWYDPDGSPIAFRDWYAEGPKSLPLVTRAQLEECIDAVGALLASMGGILVSSAARAGRAPRERKGRTPDGSGPARARATKGETELVSVLSALVAIPNATADYARWILVGYGLAGALRDADPRDVDLPAWRSQFRDAWITWSWRAAIRWRTASPEWQWDQIERSPIITAGAGTIWRLAREAGWTDPADAVPITIRRARLSLEDAQTAAFDAVYARIMGMAGAGN